MKRRALAAAAGLVLVAAAIALALLGRAVLATPGTVERQATDWPARADTSSIRRTLPERAARALLDAGRSDAFARIVRIYRDAVALQAAAGDPRGPVAITKLVPQLHSSSERSQALTMAGTLLAYSAGSGFGVILPGKDQAATETVLREALADYRAAIRADPSNEAAKYDLELLLRQQDEQKHPQQQNRKRKPAPSQQDTKKKTQATNGQEHHAGIYATGSGY